MVTYKVNYETIVKATIYDLDRKEIRILQDGPLASGNHPFLWDGKDSLGTVVPESTSRVRLSRETNQ